MLVPTLRCSTCFTSVRMPSTTCWCSKGWPVNSSKIPSGTKTSTSNPPKWIEKVVPSFVENTSEPEVFRQNSFHRSAWVQYRRLSNHWSPFSSVPSSIDSSWSSVIGSGASSTPPSPAPASTSMSTGTSFSSGERKSWSPSGTTSPPVKAGIGIGKGGALSPPKPGGRGKARSPSRSRGSTKAPARSGNKTFTS